MSERVRASEPVLRCFFVAGFAATGRPCPAGDRLDAPYDHGTNEADRRSRRASATSSRFQVPSLGRRLALAVLPFAALIVMFAVFLASDPLDEFFDRRHHGRRRRRNGSSSRRHLRRYG